MNGRRSWNEQWLRRLFVAACLVASALPAAARVSEPAAIAGQGYRLVEDWDFSKPGWTDATLRHEFFTRYIFDDGQLDHFADEWERYRDNENHSLDGGVLRLIARVVGPFAPGHVESGMVRSRWTGKYGYFEINMKVPRGRGLWPAFWLDAQDQIAPPEIDVVEIVGNEQDGTTCSFHFLHGKVPEPTITHLDARKRYCPGGDFADGFHRFAVLWQRGQVSHYVDDRLVVTRPYRWEHENGQDAGPAHVLVNLAVGGKWPGPPSSATTFPAELDVRSIRVWQR